MLQSLKLIKINGKSFLEKQRECSFQEIIRKAKKDPQAFSQIYEKYFQPIYSYIHFRLNNQAEIEDVVSQTWENIFNNIHQFNSDHPKAFQCWIFTIARNSLYKHISSRHRQNLTLENNKEQLASPAPDPLEMAKISDEIIQMKKLLQALPPKQQEMLSLRFIGDFKNKEIAKIMKIEERSVASNISRALATLKKKLEKVAVKFRFKDLNLQRALITNPV